MDWQQALGPYDQHTRVKPNHVHRTGLMDEIMGRLIAEFRATPALASTSACPDYPFVPEAQGTTRLSIIGKANRAWPPHRHLGWSSRPWTSECDSLESYSDFNQESLADQLFRTGLQFRLCRIPARLEDRAIGQKQHGLGLVGYESAWWTQMFVFAQRLLGPSTPSEIFAQVHTSNIFKISDVGRNPSAASKRVQVNNDSVRALLQEEFQLFKPTHVWFPVTPSYQGFLEKSLPGFRVESVINQEKGRHISRVTWDGFNGTAILSMHPERKSRSYLESLPRAMVA